MERAKQPVRFSDLRRRASRHGALTVEMALIVPVLLTLIFGVLQVGYAFYVQHALQDAARQGCRAAIMPSRTNSSVTDKVTALLQAEGIQPSLTTIVIQVNESSGSVQAAKAGDDICVKISIPLASVTLFPGFLSSFTGTMTGTVTLRCE